MNVRSKMLLGVASLTLAAGLAFTAQAQTVDPAPAPAMTEPAGQPVAQIENAKTALVGAKVKDSKGEALGEVKSVKLGPDGKVASVDVAIGARTFALEAGSLTYAQADKTLTSAKTKAEIQATP